MNKIDYVIKNRKFMYIDRLRLSKTFFLFNIFFRIFSLLLLLYINLLLFSNNFAIKLY